MMTNWIYEALCFLRRRQGLINRFSSQLPKNLSHIIIWLWFNNRLIDENKAEQMIHLWYFWDNYEVAYEASCLTDLENNWINDSFLNLIINAFMHFARFASFKAWLNWYHMYAAPRRHFENNCTMPASWYWSSHKTWFTNMFTLWYRRSSVKLYCNKELKKPIFFDIKTFFFLSAFLNHICSISN